MSEKTRSKNFSKEERDYLLSLILKERDILDNGRSDSISMNEKERIWIKIVNKYNNSDISQTLRTVPQIKIFYKNTKAESRRKTIYYKQNDIFKSDINTDALLDNTDPTLPSLLNRQVNSFRNSYDSNITKNTFETDEVNEIIIKNERDDSDYEREEPTESISLTDEPSSIKPKESSKRRRKEREEESYQMFKELIELKKEKLRSVIARNNAKTKYFLKKLEILEQYQNKKDKKPLIFSIT